MGERESGREGERGLRKEGKRQRQIEREGDGERDRERERGEQKQPAHRQVGVGAGSWADDVGEGVRTGRRLPVLLGCSSTHISMENLPRVAGLGISSSTNKGA